MERSARQNGVDKGVSARGIPNRNKPLAGSHSRPPGSGADVPEILSVDLPPFLKTPATGDEKADREEARSGGLKGHVDGVGKDFRLSGWAWSPETPEQPVRVRVFDGAMLLAEGPAYVYRPDVAAAGQGDGQSGFSLELPEWLYDGKRRQLVVECTDLRTAAFRTFLHEQVFPVRSPFRVPGPMPGRGPEVRADSARRPTLGTDIYVPGQLVSCRRSSGPSPFAMKGWADPDEDCMWMQERDATIEMVMRRPSDAYTLELDIVPSGAEGAVPELEIFFNYFRVGFFELPEPRLLSVRLPAEFFILRRAILTLHCNGGPPSQATARTGKRGTIALRRWSIS